MSEFERDPSANTGRFRAFVEGAEDDSPRSAGMSRTMMIGVGAVVAVILIIVLATVL